MRVARDVQNFGKRCRNCSELPGPGSQTGKNYRRATAGATQVIDCSLEYRVLLLGSWPKHSWNLSTVRKLLTVDTVEILRFGYTATSAPS